MKVKTEVTVVLSLSQDEAEWLKDYLQNYLGDTTFNEEPEEHYRYRVNLFNVLRTNLPGN